jgi:hypothetical protein
VDERFQRDHETVDNYYQSDGDARPPQNLPKNIESGPVPALPDFRFPLAAPIVHTFPFADRGNSWVRVGIIYSPTAPLYAVTPVNVRIEFRPLTGLRHIVSVTAKIIVEDNLVTDVEPLEWNGPATPVIIRTKTNLNTSRSCTNSLSAAWNFLTCAATYTKTQTVEREKEVTAPDPVNVAEQIQGYSFNDTTACWSIAEASTANGKGLFGRMEPTAGLSFSLKKKPNRVAYECIIVHKNPGSAPIQTVMKSRGWSSKWQST